MILKSFSSSFFFLFISLYALFLKEMTKSQQIEKDLVDAMTDVSILLIWEGAVG